MHSKEESRINIRDQKESKGAEDAFDDFISEIYMALGKKKKNLWAWTCINTNSPNWITKRRQD